MSPLTGMLFLDFASESDQEEAHYEAKVLRAVLGPDELVLEFTGDDPDDGPYQGTCKLARSGTMFEGFGEFETGSGKTRAAVRVTCEVEDSKDLFLSGSWTEEGDSDSYVLQIDLQQRVA